jgi:uncharacterized protein YndB with AHSA1/START domain
MTEYPYDIELIRVFDAPPERVYQAFTDPDQFARWDGPGRVPGPPRPRQDPARGGEGPRPPGTADLGRQAWEMMLPWLESLLSG